MIQAETRARARLALALRRGGLLLREIGDRLGVQRERARQLVRKGERLERMEAKLERLVLGEDHVPDEALVADQPVSTRARNALWVGRDWYGNGGRPLTVGEVRRMSDRDILLLPYVGRVTLEEVRRLFGRVGGERVCPACGQVVHGDDRPG